MAPYEMPAEAAKRALYRAAACTPTAEAITRDLYQFTTGPSTLGVLSNIYSRTLGGGDVRPPITPSA